MRELTPASYSLSLHMQHVCSAPGYTKFTLKIKGILLFFEIVLQCILIVLITPLNSSKPILTLLHMKLPVSNPSSPVRVPQILLGVRSTHQMWSAYQGSHLQRKKTGFIFPEQPLMTNSSLVRAGTLCWFIAKVLCTLSQPL